MRSHKTRYAALFLSVLYFLISSPLKAGVPTEQVQTTVDKVLNILQDPQLKPENKKEERRSQLRQVIAPRFDFNEMAKRSLGTHWQRVTPNNQQEFVKLFADLLEKSYVDKIASYSGEKVRYTRENQDRDYAEVDTKIVNKKGEEFSVNYKLHSASGQWKAYDVVIENISLVNNYRSQFNRVIADSSFEELLRRLREKQFEAPGKGKKSEKS